METTIQALLAPGKGLLAADESFPSIGKRFASIGLPSTEDNRRAYREMLFTTPDLGRFISGAILFDETVRQKTSRTASMVETLAQQGIVPGIKVDTGAVALAGFEGEKITEGLDGLRGRLAEYYKMGARFTKWRAVISIGPEFPTRTCIAANVRTLALYAALSQEAGLVPIVEPEVLMNGDHSLARCEEVIGAVLVELFETLHDHRVALEHLILKSGMILAGSEHAKQPDDKEVAEATLRCFRRTVPAAVPGIVFLSGGQDDVPATQRLNAICQTNPGPWKITFSYGRALQNPALTAWKGLPENMAAGQAALRHRAECNFLAAQGKYSTEAESSRG